MVFISHSWSSVIFNAFYIGPCSGKKDGNYTIWDVFSYEVCTDGTASYKNCPSEEIFDPMTNKCQPAKDFSVQTFCEARRDGNWRNPWDCHAYIACSGTIPYNMKCPHDLVFDPYKNECEKDAVFACKQVKPSNGRCIFCLFF